MSDTTTAVHPIVAFIEARIAELDTERYPMRIRWIRDELNVGHLIWRDLERHPRLIEAGSLPAPWFHAASQFWQHPDFQDEWTRQDWTEKTLRKKRETCLNCGVPLDGFDDIVCGSSCAEKEIG